MCIRDSLKPAGLKVLLKYLRTHAYETEDRRPDTNNIPTRAEYTAKPSSAVEAPSSSETVSSSVVEEKTEYQADYLSLIHISGALLRGTTSLAVLKQPLSHAWYTDHAAR